MSSSSFFRQQLDCALVYVLSGLCMQCRNIVRLHHHGNNSNGWRPISANDFWLLIVPILLVQTALAKHLFAGFALLFCLMCLLKYYYYSLSLDGAEKFVLLKIDATNCSLANAQMMFKAIFLICTGMAILAVDFSSFPSGFRKSHYYGFSVMDSGTAAFVFLNALGDERAESAKGMTLRQRAGASMKICGFNIPIIAVLFLLGIGRFAFLKLANYGYDVDEYGVHMNFFFTLAFLKAILAVINSKFVVAIGLIVGAIYELLLQFTGLEQWLLAREEGHVRAGGLLAQNREGLFSLLGYLFFYALALAYARSHSRLVKRNSRMAPSFGLFIGAIALGQQILLNLCFGIAPSRRIANMAYSLGALAIFSASISSIQLMQAFIPMPMPSTSGAPCFVHVLNQNGLLHFFIVNLLTALANLALPMRQIRGNLPAEFAILSAYGLCPFVLILWRHHGFAASPFHLRLPILPLIMGKNQKACHDKYWI